MPDRFRDQVAEAMASGQRDGRTDYADTLELDLPDWPSIARCPRCPSELGTDDPGAMLEHHADGSHTFVPSMAPGMWSR